MKTLLNKLIARQDLTETETFDAVSAILAGTMTPAQMGAFLALLQAKGVAIAAVCGRPSIES